MINLDKYADWASIWECNTSGIAGDVYSRMKETLLYFTPSTLFVAARLDYFCRRLQRYNKYTFKELCIYLKLYGDKKLQNEMSECLNGIPSEWVKKMWRETLAEPWEKIVLEQGELKVCGGGKEFTLVPKVELKPESDFSGYYHEYTIGKIKALVLKQWHYFGIEDVMHFRLRTLDKLVLDIY